MPLTKQQLERYSRQTVLPEVGAEGQERMLAGKVLVVGAGGLGSAACLYLAAAGVGTIGIADSDAVELSNLQRQILHGTSDLGKPKTESAVRSLQALNPDVRVVVHDERLTPDTLPSVLAGYDFAVDGTDNYPSRYLINDACVLAGKGLAHGSVFGFEGQATTIVPGEGPCYRCLYPEPPPADLLPYSEDAGVLGPVPGVVGAIQAAEAIKWILGAGELLVGRLIVYDALHTGFRVVDTRRDPDCILCGGQPTITDLGSYGHWHHGNT